MGSVAAGMPGLGWATVRGILVGGLGFVVLAVVPVREGELRPLDGLLFLVGATALVVGVGVAAVRERRAHVAGDLAAGQGARVEHVVAIVLWAIAFFAFVYVRIGGAPGQFEGLVTRLDAVYFTVTTLTTVGYGDIRAVGQTARLVVVVQMVFNVVVIAAAVRVLLGAIRRRAVSPSASP
jgi:voltage-gated potassium channel